MTCDGSETEKLTVRERRRLLNAEKRERLKKKKGVVESDGQGGDEVVSVKRKVKSFKLPAQLKRFCKRADKKDELVTAQYLTAKGAVKFKICKVISGDIIVVNNKVHKLEPQHLWRYKKQSWYIIREIDRRPVSNTDYADVRAAGMDTDADTPLIKAVLGAVKKPSKDIGDKKWIILGGIGLVVVGVIIYMFTGGAAA